MSRKLPTAPQVAALLFACRKSWLPDVFPNGRVEGGKFMLGDCYGSPGDSLPIPFDDRPRVTDFGSGWSGDDLDLFGRGRGHEDDQGAARLDAIGYLGLDGGSPRPAPQRQRPARPDLPAPRKPQLHVVEAAPRPDREEPPPHGDDDPAGHGGSGRDRPPARWGVEAGSWIYPAVDGSPLIDEVRFDQPGVFDKNGKQKKTFHHYDTVKGRWITGEWKNRPLWALPDLAGKPDMPVIMVSGAKCCLALAEIGYLATTSCGGEGSIRHADLEPLRGRDVILWADADDKGELWQVEATKLLTAIGCKVRAVAVPEGVPESWDCADALAREGEGTLPEEYLLSTEQVRVLIAHAAVPPLPPGVARSFQLVDWPARQGLDPPPQRYVVDRLIPEATTTGLFGLGGVGKTLLAQLLATCCNTGRDFLGIPTQRCRALAVLCEDPDDEVWRRQERINRYLGVEMMELDGLMTEVRLGQLNRLAVFDHKVGGLVPGPMMAALQEGLAKLRPKLLVLDNILQIYGGNINDPGMVTEFIGMLARLAMDFECAILLLGHVSKVPGSPFMGTQSWSDAMRSRLLLEAEADKEDRDEGTRVFLRRPKANYAANDKDRVELEWQRGLLVPVRQGPRTYGDKLDAEMRKGQVRQIFLDALDKATAQGIHFSHHPGANYAPASIAALGWDQGASKDELKAAMLKLIGDGVVLTGQIVGRRPKSSNPIYGLARAHPKVAGWRKAADPAAGDAGTGCSIADRLAVSCKVAFADGFLTVNPAPTGRDAADVEAHADDVAAWLLARDRDFAKVFE